MKVWVAKWSLRNGGDGVDVYATLELASCAVVGYAKAMSLVGPQKVDEQQARAQLATTGRLEFDSAECYFSLEERMVQTTAA